MNVDGRRLAAAASITAVLALGATAGTEAAWAAQPPGPPQVKQHVQQRIPWQLTPGGLWACAREHDLPRGYRQFVAEEHSGDVTTFPDYGLPAPGHFSVIGNFSRLGWQLAEFLEDCVLPYIQPKPIELPGGIVLPGYTVGPPPSGPSTKPPSGPPTNPGGPPTSPGGNPPTPPFYTLGGGAG